MRLYIDPGTGSMLFTVALGLLSVLWFSIRKLYFKFKYLSPGVKAENNKKSIVLYCEDKRYWMTYESICDEFEKREKPVTYLTGSEDDPAFQKNYQFVEISHIGSGNKAYARLNLLKAGILLATTPGLDVYQWKRSKDIDYYVHILHALRGVTTYRMFGTEFYDAVLTSAEVDNNPIREMERKRNSKEKELVVVGSTLMDHHMKRLQEMGGKKAHEGVNILLAPSWGPNSIFNKYEDRLIESLFSTGYDITIRPHPQSFIAEKNLMERLQAKYPESEHIHWNQDADNFEVLSRTDLLISDYSSVMFDYAFIFDGPVMYADVQMDWSVYDQHWCDTPNYHLTILPQIGLKLEESDFPRMKEVIDSLIHERSYADARRTVRDECWKYQGEAAVRIVDYLIGKEKQLKAENHEKPTQGQDSIIQSVEEPDQTISTGEEKPDDSAKNRHLGPRIIILALIGLLLSSCLLICSLLLSRRTEHEYEIADLQTMRTAEAAAMIKWKDATLEEPEECWFAPKTAELIDTSNPRPEPYGMGTSKDGKGLKGFQDDTGISYYMYSENESYRGKVLVVKGSRNEYGDLQIDLKWIPVEES